ncbi:DUF7336 domain-containing protein [Flavobacterium sp.]|uniref:DUF7336 domain-containing protein n=1 Tax=Flavobacterium sp. TaxID=239 RepID=UPI0040485B4E
MKEVYILEHCYEINEVDEIKFIGVYSNEQEAKNAVEILKLQPGFKDRPNDFQINSVKINRTGWTEGYKTVINIETKDINGNWKVVETEVLMNGNYRIIENDENHLLGEFKNQDIVRCELRNGILYATEKVEG